MNPTTFTLQAIQSLLSDYVVLREKSLGTALSDAAAVFDTWHIARTHHDELNRAEGAGYNPLRFIPLSENIQSRLIGDWLDPHGTHGQGRLLLDSFLDRIGIKHLPSDQWIVTVELGRVDILLRRRCPAGVVIIENKSNDAEDQKNQLYRYWYREIHELDSTLDYDALTTRQAFALLYVTPDATKYPVSHSVQRPAGFPATLPDIVPLEPQILQLPELAAHWQRFALPRVPHTNRRVRAFLEIVFERWTTP